MSKFIVYSGKLTVVIMAETAYDAAIEAVQWWGDRQATEARGCDGGSLEPQLLVKRFGSSRPGARFATFEMLAHSRGESAAAAWRMRLETLLDCPN